MPTNNKSIQILRGTTTNGGESNVDKTILETGQPFYDKRTNTLRIGHDNKTINSIAPITVDDGAINDAKVANDAAIKGSKLADASNNPDAPTGITTEKIENGAITAAKLDTQYFVKNATVVFAAPVRVPLDKGIQWSQQINPNQPWSSLFLKSAPIKSLNTKKTLILPYTDGTLATKEQIENGEIVAQTSQNATNATYAQYASEDTTKGTIEERLTRLGFKLGYITLNSGVALWPQFSSDMILDEGRTQLRILRCGNYAMIPTQLMRNGSSGKSLEPLYFTAQVKLTGGEIIGTISNNCIPDRTQVIVGTINLDDKLAGTGTVFIEQFLIKGRDGAPEDLWNLGGVSGIWTQVNEAPIGSIIYLNVSYRGISNLTGVYFPYVGPTPTNSGYSNYSWIVPSDFSVKNLTSINLYSTPID